MDLMKTYDYLPYDISVLMRELVSKVNNKLVNDSSVTVPRVSYKAETWPELVNRLSVDSGSEEHKAIKYPLVALIRNYESNVQSDDSRIYTNLTLVIACNSEKTMLSEDRVKNNYTPTLYPIYTELMEIISASHYFEGPYNPWPTHNMVETFNVGAEGFGGFKLPDVCDGIIISGLRLKVNRPVIAGTTYGPVGRLIYLNNVAELTIRSASPSITVELSGFNYFDLFEILTPTTRMYTSHDNRTVSITEAVSITLATTTETGNFFGYVQSGDDVSDSRLYFYYSMLNGVVTKYSTLMEFSLVNFTENGFCYPYYPFVIGTTIETNKKLIYGKSVGSSVLTINDNNIYQPLVNSSPHYELPINGILSDELIDVTLTATYENVNEKTELVSTAYYKQI